MLMLRVVFPGPFRGGEDEPIPYVGDPLGPGAVGFRLPFAALESLDDGLDLQELLFGVLVRIVVRPAVAVSGSQLATEVLDLIVLRPVG